MSFQYTKTKAIYHEISGMLSRYNEMYLEFFNPLLFIVKKIYLFDIFLL